MDGPRVNYKFLRLLRQGRQSDLFHNILDIGSCNLHSISGGFKLVLSQVIGIFTRYWKGHSICFMTRLHAEKIMKRLQNVRSTHFTSAVHVE